VRERCPPASDFPATRLPSHHVLVLVVMVVVVFLHQQWERGKIVDRQRTFIHVGGDFVAGHILQ